MRCFNHGVRPAVGICKACGRGLCASCAADLGRALACRGRCEEEALRIVQLVDASSENTRTYEAAQRSAQQSQKAVCVLAAVMGALITVWCMMLGRHFRIGVVLGVLLVVFGVWGAYRARAHERRSS